MLNRRTVLEAGAGAALGAITAARGAEPAALGATFGGDHWIPGLDLPFPLQEIYPAVAPDAAQDVVIPGGFRPGPNGIIATNIITHLYVPMLPTLPEGTLGPDYAAMGWIAVEDPFPLAIHHGHAAFLPFGDQEILEFSTIGGFDGGADGRAWIAQSAMWVSTEAGYRRGPDLPKPVGEAVIVPRSGAGCHLIGGRSPKGGANRAWVDHADIADHFFLPWGAARWERRAPLPLARNSAAGGALNGAIHVVSGRSVADGPTSAHHIYDLKEDRWRVGPPYPDPHGGLAACVLGDRLYACGGETFLPRPSVVSAQCWSFGPEGNWRREADMLSPRHGHGLVRFAAGLMAIGGAAKPGGLETLASTECFIPV